MSNLKQGLEKLVTSGSRDKVVLTTEIEELATKEGYRVVDRNDSKPWGAYLRFDSDKAEEFIDEFFPGLSLKEAQMGVEGAELSPKILIFAPGERLSWQVHARRAERWAFLNKGHYTRSSTDEQGAVQVAEAGQVVQFEKGERHRGGAYEDFTIVAEIWQHTDLDQLSDEDDIVRLEDDYSR